MSERNSARVAEILENRHGLTPREMLFVAAYTGLALGNAAKSFDLAGSKGTGVARRVNAHKVLTKITSRRRSPSGWRYVWSTWTR